MDPLLCGICCSLALILGLLGGYGAARLVDRSRLNSTRTQANDITDAARREADNILKAAELANKEELLRSREGLEREAEEKRKELREQERRLEKREDGLEQKHQTLVKKERVLENSQRKLTERSNELDKKTEEVEALKQLQMSELHRITELSRDQAQTLLLSRIESELADEIAQRLRKHEEHIRSASEEKTREILGTCIQRYAAEHTARSEERRVGQ